MKSVKNYIAVLGVLLVAAPAGFGQTRYDRGPQISTGNYFSTFASKYKAPYVAPIDMSNTSRMEQLIRAGNLYLSVNDAIALSLENNLGLEINRYQFELTEAAYRGSQAGPGGAFDPVFTMSNMNYAHNVNINTQPTTGGVSSLNVTDQYARNFNYNQGFATGGQFTIGYTNGKSIVQNTTQQFSPSLSGGLTGQFQQPLLRGFGVALNTIGIKIAKNNQRNADYFFQQQVNNTLNNVISAYWNLVSAVLNVDVARQSLDLSNRLLDQTQKQIDIGTMAPIDINQPTVQVAQNEQSLIAATTAVQTQEVALKTILSRNGVGSAIIGPVHIIPTSRVEVPAIEPVQPIQDLTETAIRNRPELAQARISLENTALNMKTARNQLLPTLNFTANTSNPAQSGNINPGYCDTSVNPPVGTGCARLPASQYIGGYGNVLSQLFTVPTITWNVGLTFSINLRNRSQQAALVQQQLSYRTSEAQLQATTNQIRADVQTAILNILRARAQFAAADRAVNAQEAVVDAEQRKLQLGASTLFVVIQQQNTLATTRQQLVTAQVQYATSKLALDVATSTLMDKYSILFDEAKDGMVTRRPDPIPDITPNPQAQVGLPPVAANPR